MAGRCFSALTHNWFNVAFCLCCGCLALCLTWTNRKAGCSRPQCLRWHSPCLTTSHIRLPWWQHWIMWQLWPRQQRRQSMTPTSLCRTSAYCCSMRTLGSPGETEEMGPRSDPSLLSQGLVEKGLGLVPSLPDAEEQEKNMVYLLFAESATGIFCCWFPMCFSLCFFSGSCPLPGPKSGSLPAQSSPHSTY